MVVLKLFTKLSPVIEDIRGHQLPLAHSAHPPTFFGESSSTKILQELLKYLRNEPEEDAVGVVTDFLYYLLRDGCLKTLVTTCLTLLGQLYSNDNGSIDHGWLFALNFIFDSLDERCHSLYGAPMIRPAIDRGLKHEDKKEQ
ncbi:hypothetical protein OSTOST_04429 [Ostertagia ostertagi]